jgi:phosphoadenosine phosphosulfate reductase
LNDSVPETTAAATTVGVMPDLETASAAEVLRWAGDAFGEGLVVTASFGDAVLVNVVASVLPEADIVLLDTGYLFAETQWFGERLRERYRLNLRVVRPRDDVLTDQWQSDTEGCCAARKVEPLQRALAGKLAWVTGLRRADSPSRATTPVVHHDLLRGVVKINPIATWSDADVEHYAATELLPEHPLAARGYQSIGCWPCTVPVAEGGDPRSGRWAGTAKTECGLHVEPVEPRVRS